MIYDIEDLEFEIVDIFKFERVSGNERDVCNGRPFSVLACRLYGMSELEFENFVMKPDINNYILLPPEIKYSQIYSEEELIAVHLDFKSNPPAQPELIYCTTPSLKNDFSELHVMWSKKSPGYKCRCKSLIYKIFYTLFTADKSESTRLQRSMDYLYENYKKPDFDVNKMIALSNMSPAYFRRIFKAQYKDTVIGFVNKLRIEFAKSLIETKSYSVESVSEMCGFSDSKYFLTVFKKITGKRPSDMY